MFDCCSVRIKTPKLLTHQILDDAINLGIIDVAQYDILVSRRSFYPQDWTEYNPNLYLAKVPKSGTKQLSPRECTQFYVGLMELHTTPDIREMYKPPYGEGYKSVIKAIAYR